MCDYTQVEFRCGHCRYTVRAWCSVYETTHIRCRPNVVAVEFRLDDKCGDCRRPAFNPIWMMPKSRANGIRL